MRSRNNQFKMSARAFNIGFCGCNANGPRELSINTAKQIQMQAPYFVEVLGINEQVWKKQDRPKLVEWTLAMLLQGVQCMCHN